jgi:hypothetical protein
MEDVQMIVEIHSFRPGKEFVICRLSLVENVQLDGEFRILVAVFPYIF